MFFVAKLAAADVIKRGLAAAPTAVILDAEDAENDVLRGFGRHLTAPTLRLIVFETASDFLQTHAPTDLHELITGAGFSLSLLARQEHTVHTLSNFVALRT